MPIRNLYSLLLLCAFCLLSGCGDSTPITKPVTVVMFGDSLTEGYRIPTELAVPARLQKRFLDEGHTGVRVMNMGISGDTTAAGMLRLNLVMQADPDVVVVEFGANDMMRNVPAAEARKNLATMLTVMQTQRVQVILSGVEIPRVFLLKSERLREYGGMYESLADEYDVELYDNFLAGVQGKRRYNLEDGLHPNADGAEVIANRIYPLVLDAARAAAKAK